MGKTFIFLWKVCIAVMLSYTLCSIIFGWYIYPKLGIYFSQDSSRIKTACVQKYVHIPGRPTRDFIFIDNKKYDIGSIYLHINTRIVDIDKNFFPIYDKRGIFEDNLRQAYKAGPPYKCHKVKYVSIIDLGFWKKFYIYDYIQD